jgi:chemotaxis protein MotB
VTDDPHPVVVIVKRQARHAEQHHGGAWKIAFADFMTAMMALFLVLWLINSTSDNQKRTVAQYFNPVKLVDMTTLKKGFHEPKETEMGSGTKTDPPASETRKSDDRPRSVEREGDGWKEAEPSASPRMQAASGRDLNVREAQAWKGREVGDPVARVARDAEPKMSDLTSFGFSDPFATVPDEPEPAPAPEVAAGSVAEAQARYRHPLSGSADTPVDVAETERPPKPDPRGARSVSDASETRANPSAPEPSDTDIEALASDILEGAGSVPDKQAAPRLEVRVTDEGVLISLTDTINDTMFAIGSAEPDRRTIEVMQSIARSLAKRPGQIVIRGHTDARPYRPGTSDNWRLSTARAHAARDVLLRAGLADSRVARVEGYAERSPKVATDPTAPENRRIEILLRKEKL